MRRGLVNLIKVHAVYNTLTHSLSLSLSLRSQWTAYSASSNGRVQPCYHRTAYCTQQIFSAYRVHGKWLTDNVIIRNIAAKSLCKTKMENFTSNVQICFVQQCANGMREKYTDPIPTLVAWWLANTTLAETLAFNWNHSAAGSQYQT